MTTNPISTGDTGKTTISAPGVTVPFSSDPEHAQDMLSTLACLVPEYHSPIERFIETEERMFPLGVTVVLVSAAATLSELTVAQLLEQRLHGAAVYLALTGRKKKRLSRPTICQFFIWAEGRNGMNLSPQSTKENTMQGSVQPRFNWIEVLAIPIASSIMETQPIIMILLFLGPVLSQSGQIPINTLQLTLILLSMQWWALLVQHFIARGITAERARILQVAGLCAALLIFILINVFTVENIVFASIVVVAAVLWSWKRGIDRTRTDLNEEQIINAFRIGFIIVIGMLMFTTILPGQYFTLPTDVLAQALPLFFLSGLLALSFTRLIQIQKDNALHPGSKKDPTRSWAIILSSVWIALVIVALALETFSFTIIQKIILPLWNLLGSVVLWILEVLFFLLATIFNFFFKPAKMESLPTL